VIVHRLLAAAIGVEPISQDLDNNKVCSLTENMNHRTRMAQYAERGSAELHTLLFFKGKKVIEDAYITRVKENGFVVLVPKYGFEGPVFVSSSKENNPFTYDEDTHTLSYQDITFQVFNKVQVEISVDESQTHSYKLRLTCIQPELPKIDQTTTPKKRPLSSTPSSNKKQNNNNNNKNKNNNNGKSNGTPKVASGTKVVSENGSVPKKQKM